MDTNPASAFDATQEVNYNSVAKQIIALKPRALTVSQYDDVLTLIEWMHGECVRMHDELRVQREELFRREAEVTQRERDAAVRLRSVGIATSFGKPKTGVISRYLRR